MIGYCVIKPSKYNTLCWNVIASSYIYTDFIVPGPTYKMAYMGSEWLRTLTTPFWRE